MTPRWRTRESVTHSSVTRSWKTYDDDTIDDASSSSGTSGSDVTTTSSMIRKRRHCIVAIIVFVIIVMLIAAIVPAIVLSNIGTSLPTFNRHCSQLSSHVILVYIASGDRFYRPSYVRYDLQISCSAFDDAAAAARLS